jgi:hypothetical protein
LQPIDRFEPIEKGLAGVAVGEIELDDSEIGPGFDDGGLAVDIDGDEIFFFGDGQPAVEPVDAGFVRGGPGGGTPDGVEGGDVGLCWSGVRVLAGVRRICLKKARAESLSAGVTSLRI